MDTLPTASDRAVAGTSPIVSEVCAPRKCEQSPVLEGALERLVFRPGLVFGQSWEDPAIDQQALSLTPDDTLVTIASAGDNVLALTLTGLKVYAVDLNTAQIHLLKLKIVAAQHVSYVDFRHLFSLAPAEHAYAIYHGALRTHLDADCQAFWDANLGMLRTGPAGPAAPLDTRPRPLHRQFAPRHPCCYHAPGGMAAHTRNSMC